MGDFYGLKGIDEGDIDFFVTTPTSEQGGAFYYEMHRQVYARALANHLQTNLETVDLNELRKYWQKIYHSPWGQISRQRKRNWTQNWITRAGTRSLAWAHVQRGTPTPDPSPGEPGKLVTLKIDWDRSDAEICELFKRSLKIGRPKMVVVNEEPVVVQEKMRPRPPLSERQESMRHLLRAIACQRIFDLRGGKSPEEFAGEFLDDKLPDGQDALTSRRIDESKERYRAMEAQHKIVSHGRQTQSYTGNEDVKPGKHLGFSLEFPEPEPT